MKSSRSSARPLIERNIARRIWVVVPVSVVAGSRQSRAMLIAARSSRTCLLLACNCESAFEMQLFCYDARPKLEQ
jgi:hypothetical protein